MKTYIKYFLIAIFVLIGWFSLHFIYPYIIELILDNLKIFLIFLFCLGILHFIKLIIEKNFIGIRNVLLTLLIIFLFIYFVPILNYRTKNLPDDTLISMNRFTKEISVKSPNSDNYYCVDINGNVSYRDKNKKELFFIDSEGNDNIYKMHLSVFENY